LLPEAASLSYCHLQYHGYCYRRLHPYRYYRQPHPVYYCRRSIARIITASRIAVVCSCRSVSVYTFRDYLKNLVLINKQGNESSILSTSLSLRIAFKKQACAAGQSNTGCLPAKPKGDAAHTLFNTL